MLKLSDYVIRFIADQGVKHVFLVVGGGAMHLNESLSRCREIEFICNLHISSNGIEFAGFEEHTRGPLSKDAGHIFVWYLRMFQLANRFRTNVKT